MNQEVLQKVVTALSQSLNLPVSIALSAETRLKEELKLDSMSSLTFLMALEDALPGFQVDPDTLGEKDLETIASVVSYVEKVLEK